MHSTAVLAYKYEKQYSERDEELGFGVTRNECEFFIPSEKICFNSRKAYKSEKAQNIIAPAISTFLKEVFLPANIVDILREKLKVQQQINVKTDPDLNNNGNRFNLLLVFSDDIPYPFSPDEHNFKINYTQYGSQILPHYIFRYMTSPDLSKTSATVKQIFDAIKDLKDVERSSLAAYLTDAINQRAANFKRHNLQENPVTTAEKLMPVGVGLGLTCLTHNPLCFFIGGGAAMYAQSQYRESQQRETEKFKYDIFKALGVDLDDKMVAKEDGSRGVFMRLGGS